MNSRAVIDSAVMLATAARATARTPMMARGIATGMSVPASHDLKIIRNGEAADSSTDKLFTNKKVRVYQDDVWLLRSTPNMACNWLRPQVVLVGIPGAFTGVCNRQVPGYVQYASDLRRKVSLMFVVSALGTAAVAVCVSHEQTGCAALTASAEAQPATCSLISRLFVCCVLAGH